MGISIKLKGIERVNAKLKKITGAVEDEVMKDLHTIGLLIEADAKQSIQKGSKTGRLYRRGNKLHRASAPGEPPATDTGRLVNSIHTVVNNSDLSVTVGTPMETGKFLEFGTLHIKPRPWLSPAFDRNRKKAQEKLRNAQKRALRKIAK